MATMLEVEPDVASKIAAQAEARGIPVAAYLRTLIEEKETQTETQSTLSPQEKVRQLREWAAGHSRDTPLLSDYAVSREGIYEDHP